jgi:hypothetical protein
MASYVYSQLQLHARRGFADSERLFQEAAQRSGDGNSPMGRYLQAAQNYARTLESFSGFNGMRDADTQVGRPGGAGASGPGPSAGGMLSTADMQSVCLVNHAVKEVLNACKLGTMCRMMGNGAEGANVLHQHARQMRDEGMRSIQALASTADTGTGRSEAGTRGARVGTRAAGGSRDNLLDAATARTRDRQTDRAAAGASSRTAIGTQAAAPGTGSGASGAIVHRAVVAGDRGRVMVILAQQAQELVRALDEIERDNR